MGAIISWIPKIFSLIKIIKEAIAIFRDSGEVEGDTIKKGVTPTSLHKDSTWFQIVKDESTGKADIFARDSGGRMVKAYQDVTEKKELCRILALHPNANTFRVGAMTTKPDPEPAIDNWDQLVLAIANSAFGTRELKIVLLAQCILESNRGQSDLAKLHHNYAGLKFRERLKAFATPVTYSAHDGTDVYAKFVDPKTFVVGYWNFIDRPIYDGWRAHQMDPEAYVKHIHSRGYAQDPDYVTKVMNLYDEAREMLYPNDKQEQAEHRERDRFKPQMTWKRSPKYSSRNGNKIDTIVLHYTAGSTTAGAVATLTKPVSVGGREASAHYVIGKDGKITQLVKEQHAAWHAPGVNYRSIGIEHVALPGEQLTPEQEKSSTWLIAAIMTRYDLDYTCITGHKFTGRATPCPANLFGPNGTWEELDDWRKKHFADGFPAEVIA